MLVKLGVDVSLTFCPYRNYQAWSEKTGLQLQAIYTIHHHHLDKNGVHQNIRGTAVKFHAAGLNPQ